MGFNAKLFEVVLWVDSSDFSTVNGTLKSKTGSIRDYAYIIHDKDTRNDGTLKKAHMHIAIRTHNPTNSEYVAKWFGVKENDVEKCKGRWSDMLAYLTHANSPDKYQYSDDDVVSNFEWKKEANKSKNSKNNLNVELEKIVNKISIGEIKEYQLYDTNIVDPMIFAKYKNQLKNAVEQYVGSVIMDSNRDITVLYFEGGSGTGKSTFAKDYCEKLNLSYCVSSSSNDPMQDYKGQEVLILDDLRDDSFTFTDLIKILDNHTGSSVRSRYNNKMFLGSLIIITSTVSLLDWYKFSNEDKVQLYRRISSVFHFNKEIITICDYDNESKRFVRSGSFANPVKNMAGAVKKGVRELNRIKELYGLNDNQVKTIQDNVNSKTDDEIENIMNDDIEIPFD